MSSNITDQGDFDNDDSTTDNDEDQPSAYQPGSDAPSRVSTPGYTPSSTSHSLQRSPALAAGESHNLTSSSYRQTQQHGSFAHQYHHGHQPRDLVLSERDVDSGVGDKPVEAGYFSEASSSGNASALASSLIGQVRHESFEAKGHFEGDDDDNSKKDKQKYYSGPSSWASIAAQFGHNCASKVDKEKDGERKSDTSNISFVHGQLLPKLEPMDLKNQILSRLKQKYDNITSSTETCYATSLAATIASIVTASSEHGLDTMDLKEGQLRELLLRASDTDMAEESASKSLLQLATQRPELKNLLTNGCVSNFLQQQHQQHSLGPQVSGLLSVDAAPQTSRAQVSGLLSVDAAPQTSRAQGSGSEMLSPSGSVSSGVTMRLGNDGSLRPKKIRHKKRVNGQKICLVCGDRALAHNFDVITCESCKAFFRRNALKSQSLQRCMFQNSCVIDKNTRRFCPSCRLKKCFDIGMKPELMLDDEERRLRQEKKAQRIKRQAPSSSSSVAGEEGTENQIVGSSAMDHNSPSYSPDPCAATPRRGSFSPGGESRSQSWDSSAVQSPLPSFHTLREPVKPSSSPSPSTPNPQSSGATFAYSGQPLRGSGGRVGDLPAVEQPPYGSLFSQVSNTATPCPSDGLKLPASDQLEKQVLHQLHQQQQQQHILQSSTASALSGRSPRSSHKESQAQAYHSYQAQAHTHPHHHYYHHHQQAQQRQHMHHQQHQQRQKHEEQEVDDSLEPPSDCSTPCQSGEQQQPVLLIETCPYPLPGPAARIFAHVPRDKLPSDPFMYWIVSAEERLVLANLTIAYQDVLLSLNERGLVRNVPIADSYFINDFLNEIDDAMYKIVQFSKHIAEFRQVRKEDQIAMLKSSAMQTLGIACCSVYVHERDCWLSLRGDLTLTHLRKLTSDDPYIQVGVEYCRSVKSLVKNDFTIYALIHCMILFDPRDAKIVDRQLANQTRDKFVIMLKHYLESQYSYLHADEYFVAIQDRVREMCHLAQSGNALFKRYSSAFQPLITEMLSTV